MKFDKFSLDFENKNDEYLYLLEVNKKRISSELHDTSLQSLSHITHQIELANLYIDSDPIMAKLELNSANNSLKATIQEIRNLIYDIRPMVFDELSFKEAIEQLIVDLDEKSDIKLIYHIEDIDIDTDDQCLMVYRIIQELLSNSIKHSKADTINVDIFLDSYINIIFKDNGVGFDIDEVYGNNNHFGLKIIYDRVKYLNGKIDFSSNKNEGTSIHIFLPYIV